MEGSDEVTNGNGPDLSLFLGDPRNGNKGTGRWQRLIEALEPLVPVRLPDSTASVRKGVNQAARNLGVHVAIRTFDGEAWACLIPAEDHPIPPSTSDQVIS